MGAFERMTPKMTPDDFSVLLDQANQSLGSQDTTQQAQEFATRRREQAMQIADASKHLNDKSKSSTLQKIIAGITGLALVTQGLNKNKSIRGRSIAGATDVADTIRGQRDKKDAENRQKYLDMISALETQGQADAQGYNAVSKAIDEKNTNRRTAATVASDIYGQQQTSARNALNEQNQNYRADQSAGLTRRGQDIQKDQFDRTMSYNTKMLDSQAPPEQKAMLELVMKAEQNAREDPDIKSLFDSYNANRTPETWQAYQSALKAKTMSEVSRLSGTPFPDAPTDTQSPIQAMTQRIMNFKPTEVPWYKNPNSGFLNMQDKATPLLERQATGSRPGRY